jgi:uncharacterized protein YfiM (DUF2279 family)
MGVTSGDRRSERVARGALEDGAVAQQREWSLDESGEIEAQRFRQHTAGRAAGVAMAEGQELDQIIAGMLMVASAVIETIGCVAVDDGRHGRRGVHGPMRKHILAGMTFQHRQTRRHQQHECRQPRDWRAKDRGPPG